MHERIHVVVDNIHVSACMRAAGLTETTCVVCVRVCVCVTHSDCLPASSSCLCCSLTDARTDAIASLLSLSSFYTHTHTHTHTIRKGSVHHDTIPARTACSWQGREKPTRLHGRLLYVWQRKGTRVGLQVRDHLHCFQGFSCLLQDLGLPLLCLLQCLAALVPGCVQVLCVGPEQRL